MEDPLGKDKSCIIRKSPGSFLGTRPRGDTWRELKGGVSKGPETLPRSTSLLMDCDVNSKGILERF